MQTDEKVSIMALAPGGARNKGANGEREAIELLTLWAKQVNHILDIKRNLEQVRSGGDDIAGFEGYGLSFEIKRVETPNITGWWRQCIASAKAKHCVPILMHRQNRKPWRFKVRVWVHPCHTPLDVEMDQETFKLWYQAKIRI